MITGFITGGFRPFTLGHAALIDYAKGNCDKLIIFVADPRIEGEIPLKYRLHWVLSTYLDDPQIEVYGDYVVEPEAFDDSNHKSRWWGEYIRKRFGKIDKVFSSEYYGTEFAKAIGAENCIFNIARSIIPISGTMVRNKPLTNWNYINSYAKDYFTKKVCIVGTESTGKTVMAEQLAKHYDTIWVPEKGRELIQKAETCNIDDLKIVGIEHAKSIKKHLRIANKLLFIDTDVNITKSYAKYLFNEDLKFDPWIEEASKSDLYIYLLPNAPYIDDGTRLPIEERNKLANFHNDMFAEKPRDFNVKIFGFDGSYEKRLNNVINKIDEYIAKY